MDDIRLSSNPNRPEFGKGNRRPALRRTTEPARFSCTLALRRFQKPLTIPEAEQYLATVFRPLLAVHSSPALYAEALRVHGRYRLGWYDSLILAAALESRCATLYTEDLHDGLRIGDLRVENPFRKPDR